MIEEEDISHLYTPTPEEESRLHKDFTYHPPMENQIPRYQQIRTLGYEVTLFFLENCPPSRERSLAITNLEQAIFWANAAIARNE